jgi:ribonuclease HI
MEKCARLCQAWAQRNPVRFETSKTEAILLSRNTKHYKDRDTAKIRVGEHYAKFNSEATRWLVVWIDSAFRSTTHRHKCMAIARAAENRLRKLISKYGVPPASVRNIQIAIIQSTLMDGAKLIWNGKKPEVKDYQLAINRMSRGTTGMLPSTPLGTLIAESGLTPVTTLLDHRQSRYIQRLLRQPAETKGAREVLLQTKNSALSRRLNHMRHLEGDQVQESFLEIGKTFHREIMPDTNEDKAYQVAIEWTERQDTASTDGSRQENGQVGCAIAWQEVEGHWTGLTTHIGANKEIFDAELETIGQAIRRFAQRNQTDRHYNIFSDSQLALRHCSNDRPGPGQAQARDIIDGEKVLKLNNCPVTLRWVPGHRGFQATSRPTPWQRQQ